MSRQRRNTSRPGSKDGTPRPAGGPKRTRQRTVRRSATVSPFGVGAIYDFGDESFVAMDIFHWNGKGEDIHLPRLEAELGVSGFKMAPAAPEFGSQTSYSVPYFRFPQWLFCPSCRRMIRWSYTKEQDGEQPRCEQCRKRSKLVPMRFVMACRGGHLADVRWDLWAHSKGQEHAQRQCHRAELEFLTRRGGGGGLGSLIVRCSTCDAERSLHGIARKDSLKGVIRGCEARQPWERRDESGQYACDHIPQVLQRGATNLYFPQVPSAIDIPDDDAGEPDRLRVQIRMHGHYSMVKQVWTSVSDPESNPGAKAAAEFLAQAMKCTAEDVYAAIRDELSPQCAPAPKGPSGLLREEWAAFLAARGTDSETAPFIADRADVSVVVAETADGHAFRSLNRLLDGIVLAKRIREVRALAGFERQEPGSTVVAPGLDRNLGWLPGVEVYGEGIMLVLAEEAVAAWENANTKALERRLAAMRTRRAQSSLAFLPEFSARFVLLHTLSHMLIRQLSFECGYASSSLRERIYAAAPGGKQPPMAGVLLYTADGDSEGSLGGLVREGQPERLFPTLLTAIQRSRWCSADPICREMEAQGLQGLNRAACHACSLVSETSCICANVMLDRAVLTGDGCDLPGFFSDVVDDIDARMSEAAPA